MRQGRRFLGLQGRPRQGRERRAARSRRAECSEVNSSIKESQGSRSDGDVIPRFSIPARGPAACRIGAQERSFEADWRADATSVGDLENLIDKTMEHFGGKFDFMLHSIGMSPNVRKGRTYGDLDYDFLSKTLDISAISFHKAIQVARKKDAINDWGSIVALSYIAAQRTLYGYNDMADAKALLESIARSFGYIYGREKHVRINTVSQSPTPTTAGSGVLGLGDLMGFAENMSPLGNASAEDCADYVLTLFSDLTRKVTMQNLYHDGGFSSMGMSRRAMKTYEKGMRFEDVHENQYPFGK